jgi:AAA family ATP:ADP antiporter
VTNPLRKLFDFRGDELRAALLLFLFFFLVIAVFQLVKPLKNGLFIQHYGADIELYAKLLNIAVAAAGVALFTYLYNRLPRHRLIYAVAGLFVVGFAVVAALLSNPGPGTIWGFYFLGDLESTMLVAGFWAYLTDLADSGQAKRLFGPIGAGGVIGGWVGATTAKLLLKAVGSTGLLFIAIAMMAGVIVTGYLVELLVERSGAFRRVSARAEPAEPTSGSKVAEALEGARLVLRSKYLAAIVGIMAAYEIASQVMDYQFKRASETFSDVTATQAFMIEVYWYANILSVVVQLFLVSFIMRRFGLTPALLVLPLSLIASSFGFMIVPSLLTVSLLVVLDNGLNYSLQQTARESLYTPTSPDEKYKARAFTNMFVQRSAKGLAIVLVMGIGLLGLPVRLLSVFTLAALAAMALCGLYAGRRFAELAEKDETRHAA